MPELPEVETMRRGIHSAAGATISGITRPPSPLQSIVIEPGLRTFRRRAVGRQIVTIGRLGKRIVLELDSADRIVIEPRMTGLVFLADPPDRKHLRFVIELATKADQILFWDQRGLGVVRLVTPQEFDAIYGQAKIGPDALTISAEELQARLSRSRRAVKVALLDQKALAGIGNLYASEILHRAGINPAKPCHRLQARQWRRIHAEMRAVLDDAIEHQGSTLRDGTYRIAHDVPGGYQLNHRVYQRHGQPCLGCDNGQTIRIVQAQRSTFYCPRCQR
jgi:formamidopyrimidine-DNA glycosylase